MEQFVSEPEPVITDPLATARRLIGITEGRVAQHLTPDVMALPLYTALKALADEHEREVQRYRQALWDCYLAAGGDPDTDGGTAPAPGVWTPDIDSLAVAEVRSLRQEVDEG